MSLNGTLISNDHMQPKINNKFSDFIIYLFMYLVTTHQNNGIRDYDEDLDFHV